MARKEKLAMIILQPRIMIHRHKLTFELLHLFGLVFQYNVL